MTSFEIIELFRTKPRHAGRILNISAEDAFKKCYPDKILNGCENCNKNFKNFISFNQGYRSFCSSKCAMNSLNVIEARKKTCIEKYGVSNHLSSEQSKELRKEASLLKYGTSTPLTSKIVQDRVKQTLFEKYGTDHAFKSPEVKDLARARYHEQYVTTRWPIRLKTIEDKQRVNLVGDREYVESKLYEWQHECGTVYSSQISSGYILACPFCKEKFKSKGEDQLTSFISQFTTIVRHERSIISPFELDIFCPDLKIAFEYNGDYFHSSHLKSPDYHLNKLQLCEDLGIRLIQIFEHQWNSQRNIVESMIKSIFNKTSKIYARNCKITELSIIECDEFLNINHMSGSVNSSYQYGLIHDSELVAVMTFNKFDSTNLELSRYCSKLNTTIIDGANKLLSKFSDRNIITFVDRCWSNGDLFRTLNFEEIESTPPKEIKSPNLSNKLQIFDCGYRVFKLNKYMTLNKESK